MNRHYSPRWQHLEYHRAPNETDCLQWYRFVRREFVFDAQTWACTVLDLRYNPYERKAAVFVYPAAEAAPDAA